MTGRRAIVGLCMLCALMISAIAAQGASAQEAYTCKAVAQGGADTVGFKDAHCKEAVGDGKTGGEAVKYEHKSFGTETTEIFGSSESTGGVHVVSKLKSVQSGVTLELQAATLSGTGSMKNSGTGFASGTGTIIYKEVTVTAPAGKGCVVVGAAEVPTNELAATTEGLTNQLKFTPKTGENFASFEITGCSISALNHVYTAKGSVIGNTSGATTTTTHAGTTEQNTLSLAGQKAGIDGSLTIKGKDNVSGLALT